MPNVYEKLLQLAIDDTYKKIIEGAEQRELAIRELRDTVMNFRPFAKETNTFQEAEELLFSLKGRK